MNFALTHEQSMVWNAARDVIKASNALARAHDGRQRHFCQDLWSRLAEMGFLGMLIRDEQGGTGLGLVEAGCMLRSLGEELACVPFLETCVIAVEALNRSGAAENFEEILRGIASGQVVVCPLLPQCDTAFINPENRLFGSFTLVPFAPQADFFLVVVNSEEAPKAGKRMILLPRGVAGLVVSDLDYLDQSRPTYSVELHGVDVNDIIPVAPAEDGLLQQLTAIAAVGLSAEMLGGATRVHELACEYSKQREQFGAPIGSFQAIKHLLADGKVALEGLESIVYAALFYMQHESAISTGLAAAAKSAASKTYPMVAEDAIQVHGAMGFAAETHPHLYLKRSQTDKIRYGGSSECAQLWLREYSRSLL